MTQSTRYRQNSSRWDEKTKSWVGVEPAEVTEPCFDTASGCWSEQPKAVEAAPVKKKAKKKVSKKK